MLLVQLLCLLFNESLPLLNKHELLVDSHEDLLTIIIHHHHLMLLLQIIFESLYRDHYSIGSTVHGSGRAMCLINAHLL